MRNLSKIEIVVFGFLILFGSACNDEKPLVNPIADFSFNPEQSLTIDTIKFDANESEPGGNTDKLYYRWDWGADGVWDNEYLKGPQVGHRYYTPGSYEITLEVINSSGLTDTITKLLKVEQGYSSPRADFSVSPESGNFTTEYLLDASLTKDDEDSLEALLFRWDFKDDGIWDIGFNSSPIVSINFPDMGTHTIRMEVKDPSLRVSSKEIDIHVSNINPQLISEFSYSPEFATTRDSICFDASSSHILDNPDGQLWYSWKMPPEYEWSEWTEDPIKCQRFGSETTYSIELRVKDDDSLLNYKKNEIRIYHENLPPIPHIRIGYDRGNIRTQFYFDSWLTKDIESLPTELKIRWDFDGDGRYDTEWTKERIAYHQYPQQGRYKITLEVMDPEGLSSTTAKHVEVSPWENETGLVWDHRDDQYYGTVKIGDQWWMSQNLNFSPTDWQKDATQRRCYRGYDNDPIQWCGIYGGLYDVYHATRNDWYGDVEGICPKGWHIPSRAEWEKMIEYIGGHQQSSKLFLGGDQDFNALLGGYGYLKQDQYGGHSMAFKGRKEITYFWSFTRGGGGGGPLAISSWNIALLKDDDRIYTGYSSNQLFYYIRCVKNN